MGTAQIQGEVRIPRTVSSVEYRGVLGTLSTMVRTEGARSLYSGLAAGLQRQMSFASIRIGLYDSVKQLYTPKGAESECPGLPRAPPECLRHCPFPERTSARGAQPPGMPLCAAPQAAHPGVPEGLGGPPEPGVPIPVLSRHKHGHAAPGWLHHGCRGRGLRPAHRRGQGPVPGQQDPVGQRPALQQHRGCLPHHRQGGGRPRALERWAWERDGRGQGCGGSRKEMGMRKGRRMGSAGLEHLPRMLQSGL